MEERFLQQLKKGVLELLVLQTICRGADLWLRADRAARQPLRRTVYAQGGNALPDFIPAGG